MIDSIQTLYLQYSTHINMFPRPFCPSPAAAAQIKLIASGQPVADLLQQMQEEPTCHDTCTDLPDGTHSMEPVFVVPQSPHFSYRCPLLAKWKKDDDDQGSGLGPLVSKEKWPIGFA